MSFIPYGRQSIDEQDIESVCNILRSEFLTTGPTIPKFEQDFAKYTNSRYAIAVSSGTAALHAAMFALGVGYGDEVIVPCMTFAATANCVVFQGGTPVFADVNSDNLLINIDSIKQKITNKTKAIIAVDYTGHPCDYDALKEIACKYNLTLIADSCHSLGAEYKTKKIGSIADMTIFSFHPVKHITTGEGGMITTDNPEFEKKLRIFRNHGIDIDSTERAENDIWFYQMVDLGYNYRLTDIQCALGIAQLKKLQNFLKRRREIAKIYDKEFKNNTKIIPLAVKDNILHAYHLYVIKLDKTIDRSKIFSKLKSEQLGVNVHYIPVHLHPFYKNKFKTKSGLCPNGENAYKQIISLPIFYGLTDENLQKIINTLKKHIYSDIS